MGAAVRVIRPEDLDASLKDRWREIQRSNRELASPYFSVEFTEAVGAVRGDVYVGVIEVGTRVVGFFPYHRRPLGFGRPIGLGLSDHHGVIVEPEAEWSAAELLRGCRLLRWKFDHQLASQRAMVPREATVQESPIMDVSRGFDAYERVRLQMGGSELKTIHRRMRKLAREREAHRFVEQDTSAERLRQMFALKSSQCRQTGAYDYFALRWTVELVERLHALRTPTFSGALSCVYVGDRCAAVHFGMRSESVWHWWFPSYETAFARYSPGLIMLWELARAAAASGLQYVDLGKDVDRYKRNMMTGSVRVAEGEIVRSRVWKRLGDQRRRLEAMERNTVLRLLFRLPAGLLRRVDRALKYY